MLRLVSFRSVVSSALMIVCAAGLLGCPKLVARFDVDVSSGVVPLTVHFTDASDAGRTPIAQWAWDFRDGATSAEQSPEHTFAAPGTYDVTLTVSNDAETATATARIVAWENGGPTGFVEVPDPLVGDNPRYPATSVSAPSAGQSVAHPEFGTSERRVTGTLGMRHEYSRFDPFNSDHSMILLTDLASGEWRVYRTDTVPYDTAAQLVAVPSIEEPRWDPADPNILWGMLDGFRIVHIDMRNPGAPITIKDFSADATLQPILAANADIYRATMKDEGETSADKRYWAFVLQGTKDDYRARYIVTWDRVADHVIATYALSKAQSDLDWVGMSWNGTWVVIGGMETNAAPLTGMVIANRELTQFHRIDYSTAHADVGLDSDGNEVVVMQNVRTDYIDLIPLDVSTQPILDAEGSYAGTNRVPLVRLFYDSGPLGLNSGVHISCNYAGYCVVSTNTEPGLAEKNWLDRKIVLVKLDRAHPRTFYLAQVYGTRGAYWEETQATIRNDGSAVVWATNWNQRVGQEKVWEMQLDMPAGWSIP